MTCGVVSPLIVQRRWGFLGEAIGHSGFGGAGVVWLLASLLPGVVWLQTTNASLLGVLLAAVAVALGIGLTVSDAEPHDAHRGRPVGFDSTVGMFLVGSLALGLLATHVYGRVLGAAPARADTLLFGGLGASTASVAEAMVAAALCFAVVAAIWMYRREVLAWAVDPAAARLSGVPDAAVRLGLLVAVAASAALSARFTGAILVTASLIIPGAAAIRFSDTLGGVWTASVASATAAAAVAYAVRRDVPPGPMMVAMLLATFGLAALIRRLRS